MNDDKDKQEDEATKPNVITGELLSERAGREESLPPWLEPVEESATAPSRPRRKGAALVIGGTALAAVLLGGAAWWYLTLLSETPPPGGPRIVEAPEGPVKVRPAERGGLEIPNQDKLIFDEVTAEGPSIIDDQMSETPDFLPDEGQGDTTEIAAADQPSVDEAEAENRPAPALQVPDTEPVAAQSSTPRTVASVEKGPLVQLGAYADEPRAQVGWQDLMARHPELLSNVPYRIVAFEREDAPTLFRLRAGPFAERAQADRLCNGLKDRGQGCFVVSGG